MKTIVAVAISLALLMTLGQSAIASTDLPSAKVPQAAYESGYSHGISDGKDNCQHKDGCHWYILEPGKGFGFHTKDFNQGYIDGFCSLNPNTGSDADEATWDCTRDASR
jgi:hypothetical protein